MAELHAVVVEGEDHIGARVFRDAKSASKEAEKLAGVYARPIHVLATIETVTREIVRRDATGSVIPETAPVASANTSDEPWQDGPLNEPETGAPNMNDALTETLHRAICREKCAMYGEPPCFELTAADDVGTPLPWPNPDCDEPGCHALAIAAFAALRQHQRAEGALSAEILAELSRARAKFPGANVTMLALVEEVGELAKAAFEEPRANVRKEAVQVAIMAMRVVLDGDQTLDAWRAAKGLDPMIATPIAPDSGDPA